MGLGPVFAGEESAMSDLDLMEPETTEEMTLEAAAPASDAQKTETAWPREQMLDRLRTSD